MAGAITCPCLSATVCAGCLALQDAGVPITRCVRWIHLLFGSLVVIWGVLGWLFVVFLGVVGSRVPRFLGFAIQLELVWDDEMLFWTS